MLQGNVGLILLQLDDNLQTRHTPCHHIRAGGLAQIDLQKGEKQIATGTEILSHILTKAYRSVSLEALQAIAGLMPIEQAVSLYKDTSNLQRQTNKRGYSSIKENRNSH